MDKCVDYYEKEKPMQQTIVDESLMKFNEVRKFLRVSRSTLLRMIERREIPAYKVGNTWRFYPNDVKRIVRLAIIPAEQEEEQ